MRPLTMEDIQPLDEYLKVRDERRREAIALRRRRRVTLGDRLSLGFENRETLAYQIQEMMRAERMRDAAKIQEEIDTYNQLIPDRDELSATLFIEIPDQSLIRQELHRFAGIEEAVYLVLPDGRRVQGEPDEHRSKERRGEETTASVHYLRFHLGEEGRRAFLEGKGRVAVEIDHPNYRERAVLDGETWESLAGDLRQP
jgi:hypothetical protein